MKYDGDCVLLPDGDELEPFSTTDTLGVTLPTWANTANGIKNILYTGTGCRSWVGIGTDNPKTILDVRGNARFTEGVGIGSVDEPQAGLHLQNHDKGSQDSFQQLIMVQDPEGGKLLQLENSGLLRARRIKIDQKPWSDHVFEEEYELMPLHAVNTFIQTNGHLPEVPTAQEVQENGVDLAANNALLLKKIEELTLYLIEQKHGTVALKKELKALKKKVNQQ